MTFLAFAEGGIQLVPDGTIFIHIALILLMIYVLNRTLFKPINRVLAGRDIKTGGSLGSARGILKEADDKLTRYEQTLREARAEGYRVVEQTRVQALSTRERQIEAARQEVENTIASEKAALQTQITNAQSDLQRDARTLAERITTNVLRRPVREAA